MARNASIDKRPGRNRRETYNGRLGRSVARRASIIYNPVARGLARRGHLLQRSIEALKQNGIDATLVQTEAPGSATEQARTEITRGVDLIIAAGGDGTINEVAGGMLHTDVPLAILPGGTANVLAREMHLPINIARVASALHAYEPCKVSVGSIALEGRALRIFVCMAGVGLDAEIVSRVDPVLKARAGKFSYYVSGFGNFFSPLIEFPVEVDGAAYQASFALISRVRNYGGDLELATSASLLRDDFEIVLFRGTARFRYLPYLVGAFTKQLRHVEGCTFLRGRRVVCGGNGGQPVFVQIDGELAGQTPTLTEIIPDGITMLLPRPYIEHERKYAAVPAYV